MANETSIRAMTPAELDQVSGGAFNLGPIHIDYSKGCGCIDIGIGNVGVWFGNGKAGWYAGDKSGRL